MVFGIDYVKNKIFRKNFKSPLKKITKLISTTYILVWKLMHCLKKTVVYFLRWRRGVVIITTALLHLKILNAGFAQVQILLSTCRRCDGENLWQWSQMEIRLNVICQSTILQKQFIIILVLMVIIISNNGKSGPFGYSFCILPSNSSIYRILYL